MHSSAQITFLILKRGEGNTFIQTAQNIVFRSVNATFLLLIRLCVILPVFWGIILYYYYIKLKRKMFMHMAIIQYGFSVYHRP